MDAERRNYALITRRVKGLIFSAKSKWNYTVEVREGQNNPLKIENMENKLGYQVVVMILKYTLFAYLCYKY